MRFAPDRPLGVAPASVLDCRELARRGLPRQLIDAALALTGNGSIADLEGSALYPDGAAVRRGPAA